MVMGALICSSICFQLQTYEFFFNYASFSIKKVFGGFILSENEQCRAIAAQHCPQ